MPARYIIVRIGQDELDTGNISASAFSFVYSVDDVENFSKITGARASRSVRFPATGRNNDIFGAFYVVAVDSSASTLQKAATIEVDGLPIFTGVAKLDSTTLGNNRYNRISEDYSIKFIGDNASWFADIRNIKVKDFDYGTYELTTANIQTWGDNKYASGHEAAMGLIKWRKWVNDTFVTPIEHTFVIYVKDILVKAFQSIGYQLQSTFMDTEYFERLVIAVPFNPYSQEYAQDNIVIRVANSSTLTFNHTSGTINFIANLADETTPPNRDPGSNWSSPTYTVPAPGLYTMKVDFNFTSLGGGGGLGSLIFLQIVKNGVTVIANQAVINAGIYNITLLDEVLAVGDTINIVVQTNGATPYTVTVDPATFEIEYRQEEWFIGDTVELQHIIPSSWLVKDLLLDIQKIFNLKAETNVSAGVITFEPSDKYQISWRQNFVTTEQTNEGFHYSSPDAAVDMSGRVDLSKKAQLQLLSNFKEDYILRYKADDETTTDKEDGADSKIYDGKFSFDPGRFEIGEKIVSTDFFAKTLHQFDDDIRFSTSSASPQVPIIWDGNYYEDPASTAVNYDREPRLFYHGGRRKGMDGYIRMGATSATTASYDHPAVWMVNYNDTTGKDACLSFGDQYTQNGSSAMGTMKRFHLQTIKRWDTGKELTDNLFWKSSDIVELSFREKVEIDNDIYILQKVDGFKPLSDNSTKTILLKDEIPTQTDADNVETTDQRGLV